jgi:hypothetical protein
VEKIPMSLAQRNTRAQGNVGIGAAIAQFTRRGWTVCVPLTDSQAYDLVVDMDGSLKRVQVKTTRYKRGGNYVVNLSTKGGNRSYNTVKNFDPRAADYIYVLVDDGSEYLIPVENTSCRGQLTLHSALDKYRL